MVTNNRCVAEQIKSDKRGERRDRSSDSGKSGTVGKSPNLKSIVTDGAEIETRWKSLRK